MNFFYESTHYRSLLTVDDIRRLRDERNSEAANLVSTIDGCTDSWLTVEEEACIRQFYHQKINDVCNFFKFPKSVTPVAHWLYMRFYLKQSLLSYDPKHVMLACILIATKLENMHLTMSDFATKIPNCQPNLILEIELALLEALDFNIHFFHPHSCMAGLFLDIQATSQRNKDEIEAWHRGAGSVLDVLVKTDALLVEYPSHLAMAAVYKTNPDKFIEWARLRLAEQLDLEELLARLRRIHEAWSSPVSLDPAHLKEIDKKLVQFRNMVGSVSRIASPRSSL